MKFCAFKCHFISVDTLMVWLYMDECSMRCFWGRGVYATPTSLFAHWTQFNSTSCNRTHNNRQENKPTSQSAAAVVPATTTKIRQQNLLARITNARGTVALFIYTFVAAVVDFALATTVVGFYAANVMVVVFVVAMFVVGFSSCSFPFARRCVIIAAIFFMPYYICFCCCFFISVYTRILLYFFVFAIKQCIKYIFQLSATPI